MSSGSMRKKNSRELAPYKEAWIEILFYWRVIWCVNLSLSFIYCRLMRHGVWKSSKMAHYFKMEWLHKRPLFICVITLKWCEEDETFFFIFQHCDLFVITTYIGKKLSTFKSIDFHFHRCLVCLCNSSSKLFCKGCFLTVILLLVVYSLEWNLPTSIEGLALQSLLNGLVVAIIEYLALLAFSYYKIK